MSTSSGELKNKLVQKWAEQVLFGTRIEDKLLDPPAFGDLEHSDQLPAQQKYESVWSPNTLPGRGSSFVGGVDKKFPKISQLDRPESRGEVFHFFANHELLALELMAHAILKFESAPAGFKVGLIQTIRDEQKHLRLYLKRMRELGVPFGSLKLNDYFWTVIAPASSEKNFIALMSLTFEQANLDFAHYFREQFDLLGDSASAQLMTTVLEDEIRHVKHGVHWLNKWKPSTSSHWQTYCDWLEGRVLPIRAKSQYYFSRTLRERAGVDKDSIDQLQVLGGSRGRPPVVWFYNPSVETEVARGTLGFTPPTAQEKIATSIEPVLIFLAKKEDILWLRKDVPSAYLQHLNQLGIECPEISVTDPSEKRNVFEGVEPWGVSYEQKKKFLNVSKKSQKNHFENIEWTKDLFSKSWLTRYITEKKDLQTEAKQFYGESFSDAACALEHAQKILGQGRGVFFKSPYSSSGRGNRRFESLAQLSNDLEKSTFGSWLKGVVREQAVVLVEPALDRVFDVSLQFRVEKDVTRLLGARRFFVGKNFQFLGMALGKTLASIPSEAVDLFFKQGQLMSWERDVLVLAQEMRSKGFLGHASVDGIVHKQEGSLKFKAFSELNPRHTMGEVALKIEKKILPGTPACWIWQYGAQKDWSADQQRLLHLFKQRGFKTSVGPGSSETYISQGAFETLGIGGVSALLLVGEDAQTFLATV